MVYLGAMRLFLLTGCFAAALAAQPYDLLIKGGRVIDPANQIDRIADVAVSQKKIARVGENLAATDAKKVIDARGLYVVPGLIDLHAHVVGYEGSIFPDDSALPACTTTVVDAGGAGWRSFDEFKAHIIDKSRTRVLSLINIVGHGMLGARYESDTEDMDSAKTADKIKQYPGVIVGIKTAHFAKPGWTAIDRAVAAGKMANVPVMVDDKITTGSQRTSAEKLLQHMRPGDMHTHTFNDRQLEVVDRYTGKVQPWIWEARKRGVLFDMGHGGGSFLWPVATKAMEQGFAPDTISTDLHATSIMIQQADMTNCISKLMNLGMTLQDAIAKSTVAPAKAIRMQNDLGALGVGRAADIAIVQLNQGVYAFKDAWGKKFIGKQKLDCIMTVRAGAVVHDANGLAFPEWGSAGSYEVIP